MRIDALHVSRFKCLLQLDLPQLSRITVFGGPNGVGKTTVLEAIFLFFDRYNPDMLIKQFGWRGIPSVALDPNEMFGPFFFDFDLDREIILAIESGRRRESVTISSVPELRSGEIPTDSNIQTGQAPFMRTGARPVAPFALKFRYRENRRPEEVSHLRLGQDHLVLDPPRSQPCRASIIFTGHAGHSGMEAQRYGALDKTGHASEAVEFLKEFFPNLRGLSLIPGLDQKTVLHADVGLAKKIPVGWAGEGLSRLLSIYLAMADARDGVVLIDEIGSGIHYSALPKVWAGMVKAAEKYGCQVFTTTHSYECLRAAREGLVGLLEPDLMYVLLDKTEKGIVPRLYPYEVLDAALEAGLEVRG